MKKKLLILLLSILAITLCVTACSKREPVATSISVINGSVPTECTVGDTLNFSDIRVTVTYDDGSTKEVGISDVTISPVDTSTAGQKTVTVTYGTLTAQFTVTVNAKSAGEQQSTATLSSIKIVPGTVKTTLFKGETLNLNDLQIEATYSDGTKKMFKHTYVSVSAVDTSTAGEKTLTVTYQDKTDSVTITVLDIKSMSVVAGTLAKTLFVGETLDTSKVQLSVTYSDDNGEIVEAANLTFGDFDTNTYGKKQLDITYRGVTIQYDIEVVAALALVVNPGYDTSIKVGDAFDTSKISAYVSYSNPEFNKTLAYTDLTIGAIDTASAGTKAVKVSYDKFETTINIDVVGVKTLTIIDDTIASEVIKGNALDVADIAVNVTYTDDTTDVLYKDDLTFGSLDVNTAGEKKLNITYLDKTIEHTVKVCEITSISVSGIEEFVPSGNAIDLTNMKVYGVYNGSFAPVLLTEGTITTNINDIDVNSTENKVLTIKYVGAYGEFETTFTVYATAPVLESIELRGYDSEVLLNNTYNKNSVVVYAHYKNGTSKQITVAIPDVTTTTAGDVTFTVSYTEGEVTKTATGTVKVCTITSIEIGGVALHVPSGEPIDISGLTVYGVYNDSLETTVPLTDGTITTNINDIDINSTADKVLTVTYTGAFGTLSANHTIYADEPLLESIDITNFVSEVVLNGTYGKNNVTVYAYYGNGASIKLNEADFTLTAPTDVAGDAITITVTYSGKTATKTIKVCTVTSITVEGVAGGPAGNAIDLSNLTVYGVYNGNFAPIELTDGSITTNVNDINVNVPGTKALTVTYTGVYGTLTATIDVVITAPSFTGIEITSYKQTVGLGQTYDNSTIVVNAIYGNGSKKQVTGFTVDTVNTSAVGSTTLKVTYTEGGTTKTAQVTVTVLDIKSITASGIANKVDKGGVLDTSKVSVLVTFTDNSTVVVGTANGVTVSAPNTSTGGDKTLTVTYLGRNTTVSYHVKAISKIVYFSGLSDTLRKGYSVDYSNLIIEISYTDGAKIQKNASELTGWTHTESGDSTVTVTVTYEGCSFTKDLKVIKISWIHGLNGTMPATVYQNAELNLSNAKLTLVYENGEQYLVDATDPNVTITGIDTSKAGDQAIILTYTEGNVKHTTSVNVLVRGVSGFQIVEGSVPTSVYVGQKYDVSDLLVKITYTDGYYSYVDISNALLSYNEIDTSAAGTKTLTVTYMGNTATLDVTIQARDSSATNGFIFGALLPDNLVARKSYMNNFTDPVDRYVVGDDNPFYFYLDIIQLDANDNIVDVDGKTFPTIATIYENGVALADPGAVVTKNGNAYQFKPAAVNRTFKIVIKPDGLYSDESQVTKELTVTVVDGYNVYEAWELNLITNADHDIDGKKLDDIKENQATVVAKFLATKGATISANAVKSLVIHNNLDITTKDLPDEYFVSYDRDGDGVKEERNFYDHLSIFSRDLREEEGTDDFAIYGNYYSVYSYNLPGVCHKGFGNNEDEFSSVRLIGFYGGNYSEANNKYLTQGVIPFSEHKVNVEDLAMRDNDPNSNDQSASERHIRGSAAIIFGQCVGTLNRVNVDAYMVSVQDDGSSTTINLNSVKLYNAWQCHLFLWSTNRLQNYIQGDTISNQTTTWDYVTNVVININNSSLTKCGGPVILAQNDLREYVCNTDTGCDVVVDDKSELHTYVTGQEAWFVAMGQTALASQIIALNKGVVDTSTVLAANGAPCAPSSFTSDKYIMYRLSF